MHIQKHVENSFAEFVIFLCDNSPNHQFDYHNILSHLYAGYCDFPFAEFSETLFAEIVILICRNGDTHIIRV